MQNGMDYQVPEWCRNYDAPRTAQEDPKRRAMVEAWFYTLCAELLSQLERPISPPPDGAAG